MRSQLSGEHDLHAAMKKIARSWISPADRLGVKAATVSVKARGKNAAAVEDQQVAGAEKSRKVSEFSVLEPAGKARDMQHTRTAAHGKGLLRDQFFRQVEIEVGNQHLGRLYLA